MVFAIQTNLCHAQNGTWTQTVSGSYNWGDAGNWQGGLVANGADSVATFPAGSFFSFIDVGMNRTIGQLAINLGPTNTTYSFDGSGPLTLSTTSGTPTISVVGTGGVASVTTSIAGTQGFVKEGSGTLIVSGPTSYTGTTVINNGSLRIDSGGTLGAGPLALNAANPIAGNSTWLDLNVASQSIGSLSGTRANQSNSAIIRLTSGCALTVNQTANAIAEVGITGDGSFTKVGAGSLTLTAVSNYSGSATVNAGTLAFTGAGQLLSGPLVVSNPNTGPGTNVLLSLGNLPGNLTNHTCGSLSGAVATPSSGVNTAQIDIVGSQLTVTQSTNGTFGGTITGTGTFRKQGPAELILTGVNTYTGDTVVTGGTLSTMGSGALGPGRLLIGNSNTGPGTNVAVNINLPAIAVSALGMPGSGIATPSSGINTVQLNLNGTALTVRPPTPSDGGGNVYLFDGAIQGTGSLTVRPVLSQFQLSIINQFVAPAGLSLGAANTLNGPVTVTGAGSVLTLDFGRSTAPASNILPASTQVTLAGGQFFIRGKATTANTQTIAGVTLGAGHSTLFATPGIGGSMSASIGAISRQQGATIELSSSLITTTDNANFPGGQQTILGGYATFGSTWAVATGLTAPHTVAGLLTFSSTFADESDVSLPAGTSNAPAGMTINSLRFNATGNATATLGGDLTVATGGIMVTSNVGPGRTFAINGGRLLSGNGADLIVIHNSIPSAVGDSISPLTISSVIAGNVGFTKSGPGSVRLTGANTYTGATTVNGGTNFRTGVFTLEPTLEVGNGTVAISLGSQVNLTGNAVLGVNPGTGNYTYAGPITGEGSLVKLGPNTLILTSTNNTYFGIGQTGSTQILGGTLQIGDGVSSGSLPGDVSALAGNLVFHPGPLGFTKGDVIYATNLIKTGPNSLTMTGSLLASNLIVNGGAMNVAAASISNTPNVDVSNPNTGAGTNVELRFGAQPVSVPTLSGTLATPSSGINSARIVLNGTTFSAEINSSSSFAGSIVGNGSVTLGNTFLPISNTLTLTGVSSYVGPTTIGGGTVQLGDGVRTGSLPGDITNNGILALNPGTTMLNVPGIISGTGTLTKFGSNAATLSALNSYTGGTTVTGGTLTVGATGSLGAAPLNVSNPNTGPGTSVTLNLNNAAQSIGQLTGTIATPSSGTNSARINLNGTALTVFQTISGTFAGTIDGTGSVTKMGGSTLTLSGANSYSGGTIINAGRIQATNTTGSATGSGPVTVNIGGTLSGTGRIVTGAGNNVLFNSGSIFTPGNGAGTFTSVTTGTGGNLTFVAGTNYNINLAAAIYNSATADTAGSGGLGSNNSLNLTIGAGGSASFNGTFTVNGAGSTFTQGVPYSFQVGVVSGLAPGAINVLTQSQFNAVGFTAINFSLTNNNSGGVLYLNFTPIPEPAAVLSAGFGTLGFVTVLRRWRNRKT